jgi:hypothetical protein
MFYNTTPAAIGFIIIGTALLYLLILTIVYGKKFATNFGKVIGQPVMQASATSKKGQTAVATSAEFPPLIDKPADHPSEQAGIYQPLTDDLDFEFVDEDGRTTLLREAEKVVEQIQETVDKIASYPANPEEVFTKIRAIVSEYRLFIDTEYFDAINSFIAGTVKRDCDLSLTEEDLNALWSVGAAAA